MMNAPADSSAQAVAEFSQGLYAVLTCMVVAALLAFVVLVPTETQLSMSFDYARMGHSAELNEKLFYAIFCFVGFIAALLAMRSRTDLSSFGIHCFIPVAAVLVHRVVHHLLAQNFVAAALAIVLLLLGFRLMRRLEQQWRLPPAISQSLTLKDDAQPLWRLAIGVGVLIAWLVAPVSIETVAAHIGFNMHPASYIFGPALAFRHPGAVPGLDFYAQYGVGLGWLLRPLLADSAQQTIMHYVAFIVPAIWAYFLAMFFIWRWVTGSWVVSLWLVIFSLILMFNTGRALYSPSATMLRYPLLPLVLWLGLRWYAQPGAGQWAALSGALGLSLFINTETGFIAILGVFGALGVMHLRQPWMVLWRGVCLFTGTLAVFTALCVYAFGAPVLSGAFFYELIRPLLLYSVAGFGAEPMQWNYGMQILANVLGPACTVATLAWICHRSERTERSAQRYALACICCISALLYAKYLGRSLISVWTVDASWHLLPLAYWLVQFIRAMRSRLAGWFAGIAMLMLMLFQIEPSSPQKPLGLWAWLMYPTLISQQLGAPGLACKDFNTCGHLHPDAQDLELIAQRVPPDGQAAVIDYIDWVYVLESGRAPFLPFVPSTEVYNPALREWTMRRVKESSWLFLGRDIFSKYPHLMQPQLSSQSSEPRIEEVSDLQSPVFASELAAWLKEHCVQESQSTHLIAWHCH